MQPGEFFFFWYERTYVRQRLRTAAKTFCCLSISWNNGQGANKSKSRHDSAAWPFGSPDYSNIGIKSIKENDLNFKNFYKCLHCSALESGVTLKLRTIVWCLRWRLNETTESEKERCRHYVEIFYTSDLHRCTYVRTKLPLTTEYVKYVGGTETT